MKKILIINKPTTYPVDANHPCLMSLELDNPLNRIDTPAAILELEAGNNIIQCDRVRKPFLRVNRGTLFRIANSESYVTILDGYDEYFRYVIVEVKDDDAWSLIRELDEGCEFVRVARPGDNLIGKDEKTGYCEKIIRAPKKS